MIGFDEVDNANLTSFLLKHLWVVSVCRTCQVERAPQKKKTNSGVSTSLSSTRWRFREFDVVFFFLLEPVGLMKLEHQRR